MSKFSLWLTYSTCRNAKRKPQQQKSMCVNYTTSNMNGRAIPGAYLFRLYVCDKEMSWPHHPTGLFTLETARNETPDNISCFEFDDGCISEGERGPSLWPSREGLPECHRQKLFSYRCQYGAHSVWLWMREVTVIIAFILYLAFSTMGD